MLYFYLINYLIMINFKLNYCINLALLLILFGCSSGEINDSNDNGNGIYEIVIENEKEKISSKFIFNKSINL